MGMLSCSLAALNVIGAGNPISGGGKMTSLSNGLSCERQSSGAVALQRTAVYVGHDLPLLSRQSENRFYEVC